MKEHFVFLQCRLGAAVCLLLGAASAFGGDHPSRGLWVGEAILNKVNEVPVGINAANQVVAPDPKVPTATADQANLRLILHVDGEGQVRLLKSVAALNSSTNDPTAIALVTDDTLYPNFQGNGKRIATAAFDFGEGHAADLLTALADAVGHAAGTNSDSAAKANAAASQLVASADLDAVYRSFAIGSLLRNGGLSAASSAGVGALAAKGTNGSASDILAAATSAATNDFVFNTALSTGAVLQARSLIPDTRYISAVYSVGLAAAAGAAMAANTNSSLPAVRAGGTNAVLAALAAALTVPSPVSPAYNAFLTSSAFQTNVPLAVAAAVAAATAQGAPSQEAANSARSAALKSLVERRAFAAADAITLNEAPLSGQMAAGGVVTGRIYLGASHPTNPFRHRRHPDHTIGLTINRHLTFEVSTNGFQQVGFGVDRLSGIYKEEITGLHKPLGPDQNIGLKTEGTFTLNRVSLVDSLNQ
ncbi:MAG TPA: hypothetical protein VJS65_13805 [Verrucomicrobiae bacterium]|nr:hypothetical protein [Verrucomicrobiae bacterium]